MEIIQKRVDELIPYVNNARTHDEKQVTQIAASIKEFGFNNPILLDGSNGVIAGHGRLLAAKKLGLESVPCIELAHLSEAQKKAYILADNKIALNSGWDMDLLNAEIGLLSESEIDLGLIGFDDSELDKLVNIGDAEEDKQREDLSDKVKETFEVIIECNNESEQENLFNRLSEEGLKCRVLTL